MKKINPVLVHGIKSRMRGVRAPVLMSVYFVLLLGVFTVSYLVAESSYSYGSVRPRPEGLQMLTALYSVLAVVIFVMVVLMVPALNAGNIASEREKQTLDLLLSSRINAIGIVMGKVLSNLAFMVFLLVLALPLFAVIYLLGSIMFVDIIKMFLFMVVSAYACASVATFFSALVKKTSIATILSYVSLLLFAVLTIAVGAYVYSVHMAMTDYSYDDMFVPFGWKINPIFAVIELLTQAESNSNAGTDTMAYVMDNFDTSFVAWSSAFMIFVSVLLNICSAIFIKPVQKFQLRP